MVGCDSSACQQRATDMHAGCSPLPWCLLVGLSPPPTELLLTASTAILPGCLQP